MEEKDLKDVADVISRLLGVISGEIDHDGTYYDDCSACKAVADGKEALKRIKAWGGWKV